MDTKPLKFSEDWSKIQLWCGIDAHKQQFTAHIYARDGASAEFYKSSTFRPDPRRLNEFWGFAAKYRPAGFAMEATGIYHHVIADFLTTRRETCGWDFTVVVANPADANGIPGRQKFDKADASALARYIAAGVLKSGAPVVPALEDLKTIFRAAARIERDRTALKNWVKKNLDRAGVRPASLDLNTDWARATDGLPGDGGRVPCRLHGGGRAAPRAPDDASEACPGICPVRGHNSVPGPAGGNPAGPSGARFQDGPEGIARGGG